MTLEYHMKAPHEVEEFLQREVSRQYYHQRDNDYDERSDGFREFLGSGSSRHSVVGFSLSFRF